MLGSNLITGLVRLVAMLAVAVLANVPAARCAEPPLAPTAAEPYRGVLVLREGGVLTGAISRSGDRYLVQGEKSELNVPAANVVVICHTLEEAYEHRRQALPRPTADAHLALAEWCLQCGLCPQAEQELLAARQLEPHHRKLPLLERRLTVLSQPPQTRPAAAIDTVMTPSSSSPPHDSQSLADELPAKVVERFTRKVQPLLVNNCTTTGCHRSGGTQSFQLDRALLHGMANRRSTRQNLAAVMALVNRERPAESKLLTIPRQNHGGMNRPIFGPRQNQQFQQLADWVAMLATPTPAPAAAAATRPREPVEPAAYEAEGGSRGDPFDPAQAEGRGSAKSEAFVPPAEFGAADGEAIAPLPRLGSQPLRHGARLKPWQPKDPFDPEIFNRQISPTKTSATPSGTLSEQNE
jgi:hypothetical protein